jgi:4-amino-4-deoxychorismate lyase
MSRFIESICCIGGEILNLDLHQNRVDRTFKHFFDHSPIQLREITKNIPRIGMHKCRIVYDNTDFEIEFQPSLKRNISSLKVVDGSHIDYSYKYENRSELTSLFEQRGDYDDIIIMKNGLVTDSYFANLAFFDGKDWLTPKKPLLNGTKRQLLIQQGKIIEADIRLNSLDTLKHVSLINSMLNLGDISIPIHKILF